MKSVAFSKQNYMARDLDNIYNMDMAYPISVVYQLNNGDEVQL